MKKLLILFFVLVCFGMSLNAQQERNSDPGDVMWENFGHSIDLLMENMDSIMTLFHSGQEMNEESFQFFNFDEDFMSKEERQYFQREMEKWSLDFEGNLENYMQEFEKSMENMESDIFDLESWETMMEQMTQQLGEWYQGDQIEEENNNKTDEELSTQDKKFKKI